MPGSRARPLRTSAFIAAIAAALAAACAKEQPAAQPAPPEVPVVEVLQKDTPLTFDLVAQLRGGVDVEIRARVVGYLKSINYGEGSEVAKGQLLFTIDDLQYRAAVEQAEAGVARAESALAKAELDVKRDTPLAAKRAISQAELDNATAAQRSARASVAAARASLEEARLNLSYCRVYAPVSGLAGKAEKRVGDLVGKEGPTLLTTVSTLDPIRASVNLSEADFIRFARATKAREVPGRNGAEGEPPPDRDYRLVLADGSAYPDRGKIIMIDRAVDPSTGSLRIDLAFPNPDRLLRPGFYGRVLAVYDVVKGALLVPQQAVKEIQGVFFVTVVGEGNKVETRKVQAGQKTGELWIIQSGLKPGERVVVAGAEKLRDGMVVKPVARPAASPASSSGAPPPAQAADAREK